MAGIYIHIPFCKQACHYCDFHFSTTLKRKDDMIKALVQELVLRKVELENELIETIYFGGGTPSLLMIDEIRLLTDTIYQNFKVINDPEITLEANPDDLTAEKIQQLANSPINRLSIGIQSFFDEDLKAMNRAHTALEAKRSLTAASGYFDNITIDLIYGIPNMSNERWEQNIRTALDYGVHHISSYALTIEPKTALDNFIRQGKYPKLSEDLALEHFNTLVEETEKEGFVQYEISNLGKPGYFSKHNTSYWLGKKYLGIGPSAHSFDGKFRSWNISNNIKYIKAIASGIVPKDNEELTLNDRFNETIMTGLRTIWGVSISEVERNFGSSYKDHLVKNSNKFIKNGLLFIDAEGEKSDVLKTTIKGKFLCDGIVSEIFMI
ncbi:MAG: radical SAM family heme chaperone HemW [Aureibaculum sp.]